MMCKKTFIFTLVLVISFSINKSADASWPLLSARYLIQNSDVILIGDVLGEVGIGKGNLEGFDHYWMTYWKIRVDYYLKGSEESSEFIVVTPGARNKSPMSSGDFRLDESGGAVMLFLQQRGKLFEPITPQGIVTLRKTGYVRENDEPVYGQLILKEFEIEEYHDDLVKFILDDNTVIKSKNISSKQIVTEQKPNLALVIIAVVLTMSVLSSIILVIKKLAKAS